MADDEKTTTEAAEKAPKRGAYRTLKEAGVGGDKAELDEYLGKPLLIRRCTRSDSRQYGRGAEVLAHVSDPTTGTIGEERVRFVTFSAPVVRDLSTAAEGRSPEWFEPPIGAKIESLGQAYVLVELE